MLCWFQRNEYFNCGRGCNKAGMCQNQTSSTAHRSKVLQNDAGWRLVILHIQYFELGDLFILHLSILNSKPVRVIKMIFAMKTNNSVDKAIVDSDVM